MRLKSAIYVSAVMKQENAAGAYSTILHKGAEDAGAIFVVHLKAAGKHDFYAPAPQAFVEDTLPVDRIFECVGSDLSEQEVQAKIETQRRFDPDCWVVEIEKSDPPTAIQIVDTD